MKSFLTHWRTTATGVASILGAISLAISLYANGHHNFLSQEWAPVFTGITAGIGLVNSADQKTSDDKHAENAAKIESNTAILNKSDLPK